MICLKGSFKLNAESNPSIECNKNFAFLFNVRINHQQRLDRLRAILQYLGPTEIVSIRIRGELAESLPIDEFKSFKSFQLFSGSSFDEWKLDLLEQISKIDCNFFALMQEDHLPTVSRKQLLEVFKLCSENSVDFMPLTFHPQYIPFTNHLRSLQSPVFEDSKLGVWILDRKISSQISTNISTYPVNLVGYFSRQLLTRILLTERPIIKHYSIEAPFEFEQRARETWYLPIKWAFPKMELFACVDDDHGIPGYSLSSRGILREKQSRQYDHHQAGFVFGELPLSASLVKRFFIKVCPPQVLVLPRNLKYTFESIRGFCRRRRIQRALLKIPY